MWAVLLKALVKAGACMNWGRGPYTEAHCPYHAWNGGVNWCIKAGHPCIGCCEPEFPDFPSPLFRKASVQEATSSFRRAN